MMTTVTVEKCLKCGQRTVKPPDPERKVDGDLPCLRCKVQELECRLEYLMSYVKPRDNKEMDS